MYLFTIYPFKISNALRAQSRHRAKPAAGNLRRNWRKMMKICSKMGSKMESKLGSNPWKFELQGWFGAPGRPSWRQDGPRCDFGRVWGSIWRSVGAHLGAKMGQVAAKMALSCPTWRQDGPKMAILDFKMTNLRPFWEASCPLLKILGAKSQIAENL